MFWFNRRSQREPSRQATNALADQPNSPSPDVAWKALSVTNEWIRHADAKTGIALAFAAATATALFNIVNSVEDWTCLLTVVVALSLGALCTTVVSAGLALLPRVTVKMSKTEENHVAPEDAVNLLFFGDVTKHYGSDRPNYRDVFSTLTADPVRLTGQIADQLHANAHVASTKFRWANRTIKCELAAVVGLATTAIFFSTGW